MYHQVRGVSGKPIKFVGVGEGMDDLEPFYPDRMASRILGLGDIQTFMEKAQDAIDGDMASQMGRKMQKGAFDFNDFMAQVQSVRKLGGMGGMLKMIPGMAGKINEDQLFEAEKRMKVQVDIVTAMSAEERMNPDLIVQFGGKKELVLYTLYTLYTLLSFSLSLSLSQTKRPHIPTSGGLPQHLPLRNNGQSSPPRLYERGTAPLHPTRRSNRPVAPSWYGRRLNSPSQIEGPGDGNGRCW